MKYLWLFGIALLCLSGCAPEGKQVAATNSPPPEKSTARQAIEGFTGKTAVDAGQRTKLKVKDINEQRRQNFEDIPQ